MIDLSRRRAIEICALAVASLLSNGAAKRNGASATAASASPRALTNLHDPSTQFGFECLLQLAAQKSPGPNLAVSPASLMAVFSLADIGASPNFRTAFQKTFRLDGGNDKGMASLRRTLARLIANASKGPVRGVNALYVDQSVTLEAKAIGDLRAVDAMIERRRLADPQVVKEINTLVSDRTEGKIPTIIDGSLKGANLVLINALFFKDSWDSVFDAGKTHDVDFHLVGGKTSRVPLMQADTGTFLVGEKGAFAAVQLPYRTKGYSLIVAVNRKTPSTLAEFAAVAGWLTGTGLQTQEARIALPRFAFNYGEDLLPALDALGLEPARSQPSALAGLADSPLQIAAVPHKVAIIVDEAGTTATAATAITMPTSAPPPAHIFEFVVDKPFMFALRDDNAGMTLMIGYVGDPSIIG